MITSKILNDVLAQPETLAALPLASIQQSVADFPYCNLLQQLLSAHPENTQSTHNNALRYPSNPVLKYILCQKAANNYHLPNYIGAADAESNATAQNEHKPAFATDETDALILDTPTLDYFGEAVLSDNIPDDVHTMGVNKATEEPLQHDENAKELMRVMSFSEWLNFIANNNKKEKQEEESKRKIRAMWQKEKLSKALEEETDEIPEEVFNMAVNSIAATDDIANESMAEVYTRQGKFAKAIEIYQKLSLLQPEKNTYFAIKIEKLKKEI